MAGRTAFGFHREARLFRGGQNFDPLPIDFGFFQDGRDQFLLVARTISASCTLICSLFRSAATFTLLGDDLLLGDVGLQLVRLVGRSLLLRLCSAKTALSRCRGSRLRLRLLGERPAFPRSTRS